MKIFISTLLLIFFTIIVIVKNVILLRKEGKGEVSERKVENMLFFNFLWIALIISFFKLIGAF